jgi:N-acetylglucosaminyl-diphospho-decaprenol L-rhamnosyltransferase
VIYFLVINYYSTNLVKKLIDSLQNRQQIDYKIVIINNSPDDKSVNLLKSDSVVIVDAESNLGFGCACNLGLKLIYNENSQAIVWIINPDAYLLESTLHKVNSFFESHPEISILGTIVYTPTNDIWFAGGYFMPRTGSILTPDMLTTTDADYISCDWVSGCSLIINLCKFTSVPEFDTAYFLYYEDFDFCRRYANQGYLIAVTKQFGVIHQPSSITNRYVFRKIKHSTYGYLLSLDRYTNKLVFSLRLLRLLSYALVLIPVKPQISLGKLVGILIYFRKMSSAVR